MKSKNKVLGVIPARLNSTRLPRKMLAEIGGKPLIYYTWNRAIKAKSLDAVLVATDSKEIFDIAKEFGADVVMTSSKLHSGTERTAAALKLFKKFSPNIVVNIQGDEPLMPVEAIDKTVYALIKDKSVSMTTPATYFSGDIDKNSPNFVKVVLDKNDNALFFSRSLIPYPRADYKKFLKHLGLYAFRANFLLQYMDLPESPLEKAEKLEQLRVLENGYRIKVVKGNFKTLEVNTPQEFERVKEIISASLLK